MMPVVSRDIPLMRLVLILLVSVLFWVVVFDALDAPRKEETLHVFIAASALEKDRLEQSLMEALEAEGIRKVVITVLSESDAFFPTAMMTQGLLESDVLILPLELLQTFCLKDQFRVLGYSDDDQTLVIEDDMPLGIVVGPDDLSFSVSFETEGDYGLFLNTSSLHGDAMLIEVINVMLA